MQKDVVGMQLGLQVEALPVGCIVTHAHLPVLSLFQSLLAETVSGCHFFMAVVKMLLYVIFHAFYLSFDCA